MRSSYRTNQTYRLYKKIRDHYCALTQKAAMPLICFTMEFCKFCPPQDLLICEALFEPADRLLSLGYTDDEFLINHRWAHILGKQFEWRIKPNENCQRCIAIISSETLVLLTNRHERDLEKKFQRLAKFIFPKESYNPRQPIKNILLALLAYDFIELKGE